jgi:hypothetical protein
MAGCVSFFSGLSGLAEGFEKSSSCRCGIWSLTFLWYYGLGLAT